MANHLSLPLPLKAIRSHHKSPVTWWHFAYTSTLWNLLPGDTIMATSIDDTSHLWIFPRSSFRGLASSFRMSWKEGTLGSRSLRHVSSFVVTYHLQVLLNSAPGLDHNCSLRGKWLQPSTPSVFLNQHKPGMGDVIWPGGEIHHCTNGIFTVNHTAHPLGPLQVKKWCVYAHASQRSKVNGGPYAQEGRTCKSCKTATQDTAVCPEMQEEYHYLPSKACQYSLTVFTLTIATSIDDSVPFSFTYMYAYCRMISHWFMYFLWVILSSGSRQKKDILKCISDKNERWAISECR